MQEFQDAGVGNIKGFLQLGRIFITGTQSKLIVCQRDHLIPGENCNIVTSAYIPMPTPTNILKLISGINDPELSQVQGHGPQKDCPQLQTHWPPIQEPPTSMSHSIVLL